MIGLELLKGIEKVAEVSEKIAETAKEGKEVIKSVDVSKRLEVGDKILDKKISEKYNSAVDINKRIRPSLEKKIEITENPLSDREKTDLKKIGMLEDLFKGILKKGDVTVIKTINEKLENAQHPETKVPFVRKVIEIDGKKIEGVFPVFKSFFDLQLPKELWKETDFKQFKECNNQLYEAIKKNPLLKLKFSQEQLEQIAQGKTPRGYTWHHNEEAGKMQLVKRDVHDKTAHTGGKSIWGGER